MVVLLVIAFVLLAGVLVVGAVRAFRPPPPNPAPFVTWEDLAHKRDIV